MEERLDHKKSLQFSCCWTELRKSVKHGHHLYEWLSMSFHSFYLPSGWLVILYKGQGNMSQALHMLCYGIWSILILNGFNPSLNLQKTPHHLTRPDPDPDPTPTGDKLFLSQIMSNPHQTCRISSWSSTNMTHPIKDAPILQAFSQEPSTSPKPLTHAFSAKSGPILIKLLG